MAGMPLHRLLPTIKRQTLQCSVHSPLKIATAWLYNNCLQERNILIMGAPGAGKTSVGKILGYKLGKPVIDIGDDVLEKVWGIPVTEKLAKVGDKSFLEEEGQAVCTLSTSGCVISLTGSNPLHSDAMMHLKRSGFTLYLDVDTEDILSRLGRMKVNRIVGQETGVSIKAILEYRKQFYEKWLDARVFCGIGDSVAEVAEKALKVLHRYSETETFSSTRSDDPAGNRSIRDPKFFSDVVVEGLAADGGLYIPMNGFPKLESSEWIRLAGMSYSDRALVILEKCIHPVDISPLQLRTMVNQAYGQNFASEEVAPVKLLDGNQYVLELFHGPTASFKDLALQLMPKLFAHCIPRMCNYLILVATSGDTGSAVLSGFRNLSESDGQCIGVLVFFPENGVSPIQRLQMTRSNKGNARSVSVLSDFDFCQRSIKKFFNNSLLMGHFAVEYATYISTANSINWARLLPQVIYHSSAYLDLLRDGVVQFGNPIDVCIPTGNFGNAMSAIYAKQMGIPIRNVICASNHNCTISNFITQGCFDLRSRKLIPSISPAIDILKPSNLERFLHYASGGDTKLVQRLFTTLEKDQFFTVPKDLLKRIQDSVQAGWCSEDECLAAIKKVHSNTAYIMDTHTAVAKVVADRLHDKICPLVLCSTAHYGKFAPTILKALHCSDIPQDPYKQLDALCAIGGKDTMHKALYECVKAKVSHSYTQCRADFNLLTDEVESMIQDSFLKVSDWITIEALICSLYAENYLKHRHQIKVKLAGIKNVLQPAAA